MFSTMMRPCALLALLFAPALSRFISRFDDFASTEDMVASLSASNHHGAPLPPGSFGSRAGWYYGDDPASASVDGLPWLRDKDLCAVLKQNPDAIQCPTVKSKPTKTYGRRSAAPNDPTPTPTPTPTYVTVFSGLDASIQGSGYITYGLVDTNADCEAFCNTVSNCVFFNSYYDINGKDNTNPMLTCSLYSVVHTAADATNTGGQTEPDGSVDVISDSSGYALST